MELFLIGLGIGLLLCLISIINTVRIKSINKKEIQKIKDIVSQKLDIESDSLTSMKTEIKGLKEQNENLRVSVRSLSTKTSKKELTRFQVYDRAIEIMSLKAPGFAPAWQTALRESEDELEKVFFGFKPFMRKAVAGKITDKSDAALRIEDVTPQNEVRTIDETND